MLRLGALLHDIGKIGVPDAVLRKPGHAHRRGVRADRTASHDRRHAFSSRLRLQPEVLAIVELHHEQPDGRGYPHGLRGEQIPRLAAIVHGADAFDAITSARAYRPGRPVGDALVELKKHAGTGFDLDVIRVVTALPLATLDASTHPPAPAHGRAADTWCCPSARWPPARRAGRSDDDDPGPGPLARSRLLVCGRAGRGAESGRGRGLAPHRLRHRLRVAGLLRRGCRLAGAGHPGRLRRRGTGTGWQLSVRPVVWRIRGEWDTLLDQASVRYETRRGANWRVEVGLFPCQSALA